MGKLYAPAANLKGDHCPRGRAKPHGGAAQPARRPGRVGWGKKPRCNCTLSLMSCMRSVDATPPYPKNPTPIGYSRIRCAYSFRIPAGWAPWDLACAERPGDLLHWPRPTTGRGLSPTGLRPQGLAGPRVPRKCTARPGALARHLSRPPFGRGASPFGLEPLKRARGPLRLGRSGPAHERASLFAEANPARGTGGTRQTRGRKRPLVTANGGLGARPQRRPMGRPPRDNKSPCPDLHGYSSRGRPRSEA